MRFRVTDGRREVFRSTEYFINEDLACAFIPTKMVEDCTKGDRENIMPCNAEARFRPEYQRGRSVISSTYRLM